MHTERKWRESAAEYLAMAERTLDPRLKQRCVLLASHCLEMAEELKSAPTAPAAVQRRA